MPIIASARKKMRKDKKRTLLNKKRKDEVKKLIRKVKEDHKMESIRKAQSAINKLAKVKVIHKNKAARLISQLFRFAKAEKKVVSSQKVKVQKSKVKATAKK